MTKIITCASCAQEFETFLGFEDTEQAHRCSAVCDDDTVEGFFGSTTIDTELWAFRLPRPDWVANGHMCDDCVSRLQAEDRIALSDDNRWFGADQSLLDDGEEP